MSIKKQDALDYHSMGRKGKIEVITTKPCATSRDLSLAYSPGVAEPCLEIEKDPNTAYEYTAKGNLVAEPVFAMEGAEVTVRFRINEGEPVFIRRVEIRGLRERGARRLRDPHRASRESARRPVAEVDAFDPAPCFDA